MKILVSFVAGLLFAVGLAYSGMTQPVKVTGFLDVFGHWDPTLLFVIGGATGSYFVLRQLTKSKEQPVLGARFHLPTRRDVDAPLLVGAGIFGVGWGLMGLCPGPAFASVATLDSSVLLFVASMMGGMLAHSGWSRMRAGSRK